ncbi:MAG TPA: class I SAM-dependent methyltransferase [Caldithrix abyssi]|uniref:Class I SAM-dependent methyltransferase n=1 Tax=Caldithrix abyssi TaxID=187145 RepID=A0A7V5PQK2_CALAY|nr:class I SAM-dependent methyltransferase [Caldithrix abyssi]
MMDKGGIITFFNKLSNEWDISFDERKQQYLWEIFDRYIPLLPSPVLDLGSGTGALIPFLERESAQPKTIVELDIAREMLKKARGKRNGFDELYFVQADGSRLPFADNGFGTVFCFQVVPHFEDKLLLFREIKRVLRPYGLVVVLHLMDHQRLNSLHSGYSEPVRGHRMIPVQELAEMLTGCGFSISQALEREDLYLLIAAR